MITDEHSLKAQALAEVEFISLCAQNEQPPYQYVSVEGPFRIEALADGEMLAMAQRYLGDEMGKSYAQGAEQQPGNVVVRLTPQRWLTVDYAKA